MFRLYTYRNLLEDKAEWNLDNKNTNQAMGESSIIELPGIIGQDVY